MTSRENGLLMLGNDGFALTSAADPASESLSLARRIANHFRSGIVEGQYRVGARLPTVRSVAAQVGTTAETVAAAYRILSEQGLVRARAGIGTVVLAQDGAESVPALASLATGRLPIVAPLVMPSFHETYRRLLHLDREAASGGFASYTPALELYPREAERLLRAALRRDGPRLFQMGAPEGDPALRSALAERLAVSGSAVSDKRVVVTNGGQEGLALVFRALAGPGDTVVVESPTYLGALDALATAGVRVVGVPVGPEGPDPDELASVAARTRARVFYTMPSFHNPTGQTMSLARRRRLLAVARRHDLVIVEDAAASDLYWGAAPPPSLLSLDREQRVVARRHVFEEPLLGHSPRLRRRAGRADRAAAPPQVCDQCPRVAPAPATGPRPLHGAAHAAAPRVAAPGLPSAPRRDGRGARARAGWDRDLGGARGWLQSVARAAARARRRRSLPTRHRARRQLRPRRRVLSRGRPAPRAAPVLLGDGARADHSRHRAPRGGAPRAIGAERAGARAEAGMTTASLLQFLFAGLMVGAIYGLVAVGLNIIFNATGAVNFAQGEFAMLGGMLGSALLGATGLPLPRW